MEAAFHVKGESGPRGPGPFTLLSRESCLLLPPPPPRKVPQCSLSHATPPFSLVSPEWQNRTPPLGHRINTEPAVGLQPTCSALQGRCPSRRASPAFVSSQCWCRANS